MMVKTGEADGMVAGAINSTANYAAPGSSDSAHRAGHQAGLGVLHDGGARLPIRIGRDLPVCGQRVVENPNADELSKSHSLPQNPSAS
jgi:phosphotransacetylase